MPAILNNPVIQDFEFVCEKGGTPVPHTLCAIELNTGTIHNYGPEELAQLSGPPFPPDQTLIAFAADAELSCYLALGWTLPANVIDLRIEHMMFDLNVSTVKHLGASLEGALAYYGLSHAVENKTEMQTLASTGAPQTLEAIGKMKSYCFEDCVATKNEPTHPDFTWRRKLLMLIRLVPMAEKNYNLIELGPRETGKSFVYREISPYVILLSGGQGSVADLFGWKNRKDKPGLVVRYDVVAFDEVAGSNFKAESDKQMYKGYMEQGSFSRGDDKGTISAEAGIVFNGNIDGDPQSIARVSHLFAALPESVRNDSAFHDRWLAYLPGWEMPKLKPEHFTSHLGFVADYMAEIFHNELRPLNFTDIYDTHFAFGNHVGQRDRKAAVRTVSGLLKLIHPNGKCTREELAEYVALGLEMRRRVKEQLKRLNPIEFSRVNLSYLDKNTGDEFVAECAELGASKLIPETPLQPGDIFCVGYDPSGSRVVLFRVQIAAPVGSGKFQIVGITSKAIRESARMAFDYLRINGKKVGLDRDMGSYDFNIQVMSPMSGKDSEDLGVAFYVALVSALVNKPTAGGLVVLGQMSIHGVLSRIEQLGDRLRVAMDAGARQVLIPTANAADLGAIPAEVLDKVRVDFYSEPSQAAFKALAE